LTYERGRRLQPSAGLRSSPASLGSTATGVKREVVDVNLRKDEFEPGQGQRDPRETARLAHLPGRDRGSAQASRQSSDRRLERLQSIADAALGYMSLEGMLGELLERIRTVLGVDTAAVLLLDEDRNMLVARAARGLEEEVRQGVQIPVARGFAGRVASGARPIVIEDLSRAEIVNPILRQRGIRSMLGVPVHVEGRVIGVMHIGTLQRRAFGEDDVALLQLAADRWCFA
jgi:transcriptional regulator with GAF, ATPase, and Fis domain